jgi:hypothetical protein
MSGDRCAIKKCGPDWRVRDKAISRLMIDRLPFGVARRGLPDRLR